MFFAAPSNSYGGTYNYGSKVYGPTTVNNSNVINLDGVTLTPSSTDQEFFSTKIKFESSSPTGHIMSSGVLTANGGEFNVSNNSTLNGSITGASNTVKNTSATGSEPHVIDMAGSTALLSASGQQINVNDSTINGSITGAKNEATGVSSTAYGGVYVTASTVTFTAKSGDIDVKNSFVSGDIIGATNRSVADQAYSGVSANTSSKILFTTTNDNLKLDNTHVQGKIVGANNYIEGWGYGLNIQTN